MNGNTFFIPLDSTDPKDIAALDRELNRLLEEGNKPNGEENSDKGQHTA